MKTISPAEGPVNVKRFTLYALIPGLDTYALSKLDKKKQGVRITIVGMLCILAFTGMIMYQMVNDSEIESEIDNEVRANLVSEKYLPLMLAVIFGFLAFHLPIIAYLVNKWAKEWNQQFA